MFSSMQTSLVDIYRKDGIDSLRTQLEEILQVPLYWKEYLSDKNVSKGFYEYDTPIVFVDKKSKTMQLYHNIKNTQKLKSSQSVLVGKMGDKQKEGDLKTPVGVYDITRRFVPTDTFYGPISYELSYPNIMDRLNKKDGYGIWIHGYPLNNEKRDGRTKGCVVLQNDILTKFDEDMGVDKAIVIISEQGDIVVQKSVISNMLAQLFRWRSAWKNSNLKRYLSFYDENFKRFDGKNKKQFKALKKGIFANKERKIIRFTNITISPYPSTKMKDLYRITFHEFYKTKHYKFEGKKELYVKMSNKQMKIIAEK